MYFGERALLNEEPRAADVVATSDVRVLTISKALFEECLGPLQDIIKADRDRRERRALLHNDKIPLEEIQLSGTINLEAGAMDIGEWVSGSAADGAGVTLRILNKTAVEAHGLSKTVECCALVARELQDAKDVGEAAVQRIQASEGICLPQFTYKDENRVYMLYKRSIAASIQDILEGEIAPPEDHILYIARCIAHSLVALHEAQAVYRSLSLDHVFIDNSGYICLADFGFSKWLAGAEQAFTICGTAEYLAPEQVKQTGYTSAVDWWALGCLIYEILHGQSPFLGQSELAIYNNITSHTLGSASIDAAVSPTLKSLIQNLLHPDPSERIAFAKSALLEEALPSESPLKAWASQKYEELRAEEYDEGGLPAFPYQGDGTWFDQF
eukprot:scaffold480_cov257-Pinguiococcus_pyrenoidosus.AAC.5